MAGLFRIPFLSFDAWLLDEIGKARSKISELERRHPGSSKDQLAQRLIDEKKETATTGGAVAGFFGLAAIPADLAMVAFLRLRLSIEIAVLFGVNLKGATGRTELLDVLGLSRADMRSLIEIAPLLAARVGGALVRRVGWRSFGRLVPVVAAPLAAWINNRDIQRIGDEAVRRFGTFQKVRTAPRE